MEVVRCWSSGGFRFLEWLVGRLGSRENGVKNRPSLGLLCVRMLRQWQSFSDVSLSEEDLLFPSLAV